ncbi:hypothetical protein DICVIV_13398 [Dictyocaulus viviparus]|uniref:Uncharacterized protein n=1 Tax=Dictyocaulus viviparus TaxID=29172 RepID=A0A0D8XA50_DICVI|nr:hypothetical protein DICVIV_13398 [Dictyocaulus viviparus]
MYLCSFLTAYIFLLIFSYMHDELMIPLHLPICQFVVFNIFVGILGFYIWLLFPRRFTNETSPIRTNKGDTNKSAQLST